MSEQQGAYALARLAAIIEGSEEAILAYKLDGIITDWNPGASRLYGYSAEEAIGQNLLITVPPNSTNETKELLAAVAAGERIRHFEALRRRKDGT